MTVIDSHSPENILSSLDDLSFKSQHDDILAFFALQLDSNSQTSILCHIQDVHYLLFTYALDVSQEFLDNDVLTCLQDNRFDCYFIVEVKVLHSFSFFVANYTHIGILIIRLSFHLFLLLLFRPISFSTFVCVVHFFFLQPSLILLLTIELVLQSKFALFIDFLEVILYGLQCLEH